MTLDTLTALSPLDGRYRLKIISLVGYFSEFALIRYRLRVEVEYLIALAELGLPQLAHFDDNQANMFREMYLNFSLADAEAIKVIEKTTNHDIKALEYWVKSQMSEKGYAKVSEFVHFGLTSQDINNTAIPLLLKEAQSQVLIPALEEVLSLLKEKARIWAQVPMLARTHGQPASPTTVGKEIAVFIYRLENQVSNLKSIPITAKFGGATGNFNAHRVAYPNINWPKFADKLIERFGLIRSQLTTQIDNYETLAALLDCWRRIATVLIDLCQDFWLYISMDYFKQKPKEEEIGSSAMPHKINPIDFENAEGNLGIAVAMLGHLSEKLPVSRLQRDLTDSTVLRNLGVPFAHILLSINSISQGITKLQLNAQKIESDLSDNWAVIAEGVQTILRREKIEKPYEQLKALTRTGQKISRQEFEQFINQLPVSENVKNELRSLTPQNYLGYSIDFQNYTYPL